jgi:hypothetical protein
MKITASTAQTMISTYEWSIAQLSDVSLYGPPTRHVYYFMLYGGETREESLRTDLERLQYWRDKLKEMRNELDL